MIPHIDIQIACDGWPPEAVLRSMVVDCVNAAVKVADLALPEESELSLVFTDDAAMQDINGQWRGLPKPTNVLSFPGSDVKPGEPCGTIIGDVVLALETVQREADLDGKPFNHHLSHLIVHGFLHLFGYDHISETEAATMEGLETRILAELGIANPYA